MPKLSDIKKKNKANNSLKTDVRIGHIDESISEIFHVPIDKKLNSQTDNKQVTNGQQTGNKINPDKVTSNRRQIDDIGTTQGQHGDSLGTNGPVKQTSTKHKSINDLGTRKGQHRDSLGTSLEKSSENTTKNKELSKLTGQHRDSLETTWGQLRDNIGTESGTGLGTTQGQHRDNLGTDIVISGKSISHISGAQLVILKYLFGICRANASFSTGSVSIDHLSEELKLKKETAKKSIQRLINKGYLERSEFFRGRSGWTIYLMNESIFRELSLCLRDNIGTSWGQHRDVLGTESGTESGTNPPSSSISSFIYKENTTTNEQPFNPADVPGQQHLGPQFDTDWQNIDITPLASIGFTNNHLSQIFTKNELTPKQVQDSINAFAFDLEENKRGEKIKTSPLNLFMGILKGGNPYNPPKNYESDEDRVLREQVEAEREKLEKRRQMQSELNELKYQNWLLDLTIEKKLEILDVPQGFFDKMPVEAIQEGLKKHFEMKVL